MIHILRYIVLAVAAVVVGLGLFDVGRWWEAEGREQWKREMNKNG